MKKIASLAFAAVVAATSFGSTAAPVFAAETAGTTIQVAQVGPFGRDDDRSERRRDRDDRYDRHDRDRNDRFERRGNYGYYRGHRGYREYRRGYREYNGFWFPPAAFGAGVIGGAIIGGVIANQNNNDSGTIRLTQRHLQWCENQYRSYRASDNTFQPYNGPRQQCVSPY